MSNNMKKYFLVLMFSCSILSGCGALKEETGEYVTEAVRQKIVNDIDMVLEKRGLSIKEMKQAISTSPDGSITKADTISTVKEMTKDYVLLEAKNYVEQKMKDNEAKIQASTVNKNDLESKSREFWQLILGLVAAYLTKQVWSAKSDGKRDERLTVLEKLLGDDDNGDPVSNNGKDKPEKPNA